MSRSEFEYRGYCIEVCTRSRLARAGDLEYAAEVRATADQDDAETRCWTPISAGEPTGYPMESDALENGMRRGFAYVDALTG